MIKGRKPVAFAGTASCPEILQLKKKGGNNAKIQIK